MQSKNPFSLICGLWREEKTDSSSEALTSSSHSMQWWGSKYEMSQSQNETNWMTQSDWSLIGKSRGCQIQTYTGRECLQTFQVLWSMLLNVSISWVYSIVYLECVFLLFCFQTKALERESCMIVNNISLYWQHNMLHNIMYNKGIRAVAQ